MDQAEIGKLYRLQTGETAKLLQKKPGGWKEFLIVSTKHANGTLGLQEGEILTSRVKEDALLELGPDGSAIRPTSSNGAGHAIQNGSAETARSLPSSASLKRKAQMKSKNGTNFGLAGRRGSNGNGKHKGLARRGSSSDVRSSKGYDGLRTSSPNLDTSGRSLQNLVDVCHHVMEIEDTPSATAPLAAATAATASPSLNLSRSFDSMVTISSLNGLRTPPFGFSQPASPLLLGQGGGRSSASQSPTIPMLASPVFTPQASPTQERRAQSANSELMDVAMPDVSEEDILQVWNQQNAPRVSLAELPNSVLFRILAHLPIQTLSRVEALKCVSLPCPPFEYATDGATAPPSGCWWVTCGVRSSSAAATHSPRPCFCTTAPSGPPRPSPPCGRLLSSPRQFGGNVHSMACPCVLCEE